MRIYHANDISKANGLVRFEARRVGAHTSPHQKKMKFIKKWWKGGKIYILLNIYIGVGACQRQIKKVERWKKFSKMVKMISFSKKPKPYQFLSRNATIQL